MNIERVPVPSNYSTFANFIKYVQEQQNLNHTIRNVPCLEQADPRIYTACLSTVPAKKKDKNNVIHGSVQEFSNDLLSILNDASSSDVTIKIGIEELKAHKIILSARSPVFKAMLSNDMRESNEGSISIDDMEVVTARDMLFFIYSNQVENMSVEKALDLLDAAEKYQLQSLKTICVDFLMSSISVENAFLILQKADLYDKDLKLHSMKFIRDKFSNLKAMEEWKTVQSNNPALALEVLNMVVEKLM